MPRPAMLLASKIRPICPPLLRRNLSFFAWLTAVLATHTCLGAQTEVVKSDDSARLRAAHAVNEPDASSRVALETSTDLAAWNSVFVEFDAESGSWSLPIGTGMAIHQQTEASDGEWQIVFEAPLDSELFTRVNTVQGPFPADATTTQETRNLLKNLHRIGWEIDGFMMGHEFPLSFTLDSAGESDTTTSDIKDVVGDHPGVHGSDFHFMIDKGPEEIARHKAAARAAYEAGAIVTFDYHWMGKYGNSHNSNIDDDKILYNVVNNDDSAGDVTWFYEHLDEVLDIINNDLKFPIVFRPFHEMDGNWFWWGRQIPGGAETYQKAYQALVDYMKERTEYVLFCWSPDVSDLAFEKYYPGDDYVDVIGRDIYSFQNGETRRSISQLEATVDFALARGKVAAFTETGYTAGGASFETGDPDWWTTRILEPIKTSEKAINVAWVLTWINSSWSGPYVPHKNSPQAAKDDFIKFYNDPATLFQQDVAALKVYEAPPQD